MEKQARKPKDSRLAASDAKPTVVGIGASAGGLNALKRFFELMPPDSGLVFVVVVHLSPEHKSLLADLLQPSVRFPVQQVSESTPLHPNHVYVIPPNANLSAIDSHLRLSKLEETRRERAPIDHFFRTLAATHDGHSIGVILTGTGSDGTLGLKEIKAKGGLVLVQDPNDAEFDGMPQSAIATGLVDRVLPIAEIPEALVRLVRVANQIALTRGNGISEQPERVLLPKILAILKTRTERDFSRYKPATLLRRIGRRMQLNYIEDLDAYVEKLREQPEEVRALGDDLLINVTSFFRDAEVFSKLQEQVVPQLMEGKGSDDTVRVWSVGCATGEEAYSVAMLLIEESGRRGSAPRIQIFASDLHKRSLESAREGVYPGDIEGDVSSERLKRFFQKQNGGYRISKEVRDMVVFAPHNLLSDPPFSRLNLITCRNLLIYLDRAVQHDVTDLFHYALCPNGYLLLGSAERIDASDLFRTEDKKVCLYRKRNVPAPEPRLPVFPLSRLRVHADFSSQSGNAQSAIAYNSLHQNLLERYAPPSILIGPDNKVVHLSENAGRYLIHPGGEVTMSALRLVRNELRIELQTLLLAVREKKELVDSKPIQVRFNGHSGPVVMHVRPAQHLESEGFALVIFEEHAPQEEKNSIPAPLEVGSENGDESKRMSELEAELHTARQRLQTTIEEYETSREEMNASAEEMQSTNEELRSTLEELETSKEELQSINEELQTVNQENRHKVEELSQLSSDLQNLLSSTDIATLFLDRDLRILRFTPRLAGLFNVRVTDRGRPISDLTHRLGYAQLRQDAQGVLDRLIPVEREIRDDQGRWYLTRLLPYRSTEDRIEGVVITFTEITIRKSAEEALRESEERQAFLLKLSDALKPLRDAGDIQRAALRLLGEHLNVTRAASAQSEPGDTFMRVAEEWKNSSAPSIIGQHRMDEFGTFFSSSLRDGGTSVVEDALNDPRVPRKTYDLTWRAIDTRAAMSQALVRNGKIVSAIFVHHSEPRSWTKSEISIVSEVGERMWGALERAGIETAQRRSEEKYRSLFESIDEGFCVIDLTYGDTEEAVDYRFREANPAFERQTGFQNVVGKLRSELDLKEEPYWLQLYGDVARTGVPQRLENYHETTGRWYSAFVSRVGGLDSHRVAIVLDNITERKKAEAALRANAERQSLMLKLSDTLQTISDPDGVQHAAMRVLSEHLGLSRAFYFRVERDHGGFAHVIEHEYRRDPSQPSMIGRHSLKRFGSWLFEGLEQGRAVEVPDIFAVAGLTPEEVSSYQALGVVALINIPLLRNGEYAAGITAHSSVPRAWTPYEVALIREVAERAWDAIQRARAEAALGVNERRLRAQKEAFQAATTGAALQESLGTLVRLVTQEMVGTARSAFYIADPDLNCLHPIAGAFDMPDSYMRLVDCFPMGHESLACGLASASGQAVLTRDVFEDPLWEPWIHLAKDYDFRGCWSFPIETRDHKPIGTFAMYLREPRDPAQHEIALAEVVTQTAAIIISRQIEAQERSRAEENFRLFVENVQEYALVQTDPDGLITSWNPGAKRLFGYTPEQVLRKNFSVLLTPADQEAGVFEAELAKVTDGYRHEDARWFVREDDSRFWARWITEPMRDENGGFRGLAKIMRDETERERSAAFTRHSLAEKEELLKEVHHRVKNNLQVIISLINLQASQIRDENVLALFQETRNRVLAISSIHELLYRAESFANIVVSEYAKQLASGLVRFYGLENRIRVEVAGNDATLELERAVPFGMLLNELVSNSCKHAFAPHDEGAIRIEVELVDKDIQLVVADTGRGLPPGFNYENSTSLGLKLVRSLARQLRGTLEIRSERGVIVTVRFPEPGQERDKRSRRLGLVIKEPSNISET